MSGPFERKRPPSTSTTTPARSSAERAPLAALVVPVARSGPSSNVSRAEEDEARSSSKYRAALEALFAPKQSQVRAEPAPVERPAKKVVTVPSREDPRGPEREKRLAKLLGAEGRAAVTKAAEDLIRAGFEFPHEQEIMLKLLDHDRDDRVRGALEALAALLEDEPPQRRAVLDARLRRLEGDADDADIRTLAGSLLKKVLARGGR